MSRYSKVSRRMWVDADFRELTPAPPNGQTLWTRLLTGPELTCIPGLFPAWEAGLAEALKWPLKGFREAFAEVSSKGMAKADWKAGLVWVPNAFKHNVPESPNVVRSWRVAWEETPECALKLEAYRRLKAFCEAKGEAFAEAFAEACRHPSPNQEQEQEQEQEEEVRREVFEVDAEPASKPPKPAHRSKPVNGQPPREPKAHVRYAEAYAAGMREATGAPFTVPRTRADLIQMATEHARTGADPLRGADLLAWFSSTAKAYRLACPNGQFQGGYDPAHCLRWLNAGRPADRGRGPSMRQPPASADPAWTPQDGSQGRALLEPTEPAGADPWGLTGDSQ